MDPARCEPQHVRGDHIDRNASNFLGTHATANGIVTKMKQVRVFILGAGCSVNCGYSLGVGLGNQLHEFKQKLPKGYTRIRQRVSDTISLLETLPAIKTLDQLAKHLEDELAAKKRCETDTDDRILNAKIAISAMFVACEEQARAKVLPGYTRLLDSLFGGEPWQEAVSQSDAHVLSFNYDRVLEMAFLKHFKSFNHQQQGIYSGSVLNSGFNHRVNGGHDKVELIHGRFCFLKLHGSAGWWVRKAPGNQGSDECRRYWPAMPSVLDDLQDFEERLKENEGTHNTQPWEPLIAFPHEKQRAVKHETDFLADRYLEKIELHAATVLASATEVKIVGYSFAPIDSRHVVINMLSKIPENSKIIVWNPDVAAVQSRLEAYPTMRGRIAQGSLVFDSSLF